MKWIALNASVGTATAKNNTRDVKIAQFLLNAYLRGKKKTPLKITGKINEETNKVILAFQKDYLKMGKPDGRIDRAGRTYKGLVEKLKNSFTTQAIVPPIFGVVTWGSEGNEGGVYHSRKLHVPGSWSGLTIGRGYDMKFKSQSKVFTELTSAGIDPKQAQVIKKAVGLYGSTAKQFIIDNDLLDLEISVDTQKKLFKNSYDDEVKEVKRLCALKDVVNDYGKTDWKKLNGSIKDIVVDLKFRGDYTVRGTMKFLQKSIVDNDLDAFRKEIVKKSNWKNVPEERFQRRKRFMEKATVSKAKKAA